MSDLYLYDPEICDGDLCVFDCSHCPKREEAEQAAYEQLEGEDRE